MRGFLMTDIGGNLDDGGIAPKDDPMASFAQWMADAAKTGLRARARAA